MLKRFMFCLSLIVFAAAGACAQDTAESYAEGTHYDLIIPAVRTADPKTIEVVEFFWYGCGHCYNFEPMIGSWKKTLPVDVKFRGSPAVWNPSMELHAKAFYVAEVLGVLDTMHPVLFQAMNVDRKRLGSEAEVADLFAAHGVASEDFSKAIGSFGVSSQARQATARAKAAKITGTPEMMVNGKYRISTRKAGSQANMLKIASYLIDKERSVAGS